MINGLPLNLKLGVLVGLTFYPDDVVPLCSPAAGLCRPGLLGR